MSEFLTAATSYGGWGITLVFLWLMIKGEILTRAAVENIVKLTVHEIGDLLRAAVRDGIVDAREIDGHGKIKKTGMEE